MIACARSNCFGIAGVILLVASIVVLSRAPLRPVKLVTHIAVAPPTNRFPGVPVNVLGTNWVAEEIVMLGKGALISSEDYRTIYFMVMKKHRFLRGIESMLIYDPDCVVVRFKADSRGRVAELMARKDATGWYLGNEVYIN